MLPFEQSELRGNFLKSLSLPRLYGLLPAMPSPAKMLKKTTTPERSTAAAFPRYLTGEVVADSVALQWTGLYARRWRLPRIVDRFLVPATPEPHISCNLRGSAEFREREVGGAWITRQIRAGDLFVTRSRTPYEVDFQSPPGQELDNLSIHLAVEPFLAALEARYPGGTDRVEVADFF